MRDILRTRLLGAILAVVLVTAACGSGGESQQTDATGGADTTAPTVEGPTITVGSFNFPESVILAEIYAQALEGQGYPIERKLNLGSRELVFPSLESGEIDFIPEYLGSSLTVGFGEEAFADPQQSRAALEEAFAEMNMAVLDYTPGEDKNVFVVTEDFAAENGVSSVADLAGAGDITLGGPPECEERETCYAGLVETYDLDNLSFAAYQETSARVGALEQGQIDVALLFSTQPVIAEKGFVVLEEPEGLIASENVAPVVSQEIVDAYGQNFVSVVNSISTEITTETLLDLNGRVELEAQDPDDVARDWLVENGFIQG